jgi:hypothetical protein
MAQTEEKQEKSLLETISSIGTLESELLENEEVKSETEEVVEETQPETVEEASTFKVWGEDDDKDAEDSDEDSDEVISEPGYNEEEDEEDDTEEAYGMKDDDEDPSDEDSEDEVETDNVEVSADDAEEDMEDEVEDEVTDDDDDEEESDVEDSAEEDMEEAEVVDGDSEEEDGIDGAAEPDQDVDSAVNQISKTVIKAATHKAMEKINATYGSMKEDLDALCAEDDSLSEDFKKKAATIFEAAVTSKVAEAAQSVEDSYVDFVNEEVNSLHEGLIDKIDSYLTYVAEQWIEKNDVAVTNSLRTDIAEAFMSSLKTTFVEHYIEMPEGKTDMFDEVSQQNAELSEDVESKKEEIAKLEEQILTLSKDKIISDLSEGLVDTQKAKFKKLTADITFESAEQFTEKAQIVRESYFSQKKEEVQEELKSESKVTTTEVVVEEVKDESDGLSPLMSRYINASSKLEKEAF